MRKILLLVVFFASFSAYSGQWTGVQTIKDMYIHSSDGGHALVKFPDMSINPYQCNNQDLHYIVDKANNPVFSEIYSLLLTAYTTKENVQLFLGNNCSVHGHPMIEHVRTR